MRPELSPIVGGRLPRIQAQGVAAGRR